MPPPPADAVTAAIQGAVGAIAARSGAYAGWALITVRPPEKLFVLDRLLAPVLTLVEPVVTLVVLPRETARLALLFTGDTTLVLLGENVFDGADTFVFDGEKLFERLLFVVLQLWPVQDG